jgi:hypothetical protein
MDFIKFSPLPFGNGYFAVVVASKSLCEPG